MTLIPDVHLYLRPLDPAWMCESLKKTQENRTSIIITALAKIYIHIKIIIIIKNNHTVRT
jgi:hypothetical protein